MGSCGKALIRIFHVTIRESQKIELKSLVDEDHKHLTSPTENQVTTPQTLLVLHLALVRFFTPTALAI